MRSFYRSLFARFLLVVFGLFAGTALAELLCFGMLKVGYTAANFTPAEGPPPRPAVFAHEIPAALEKLPWVEKKFPAARFDYDAYDLVQDYWTADDDMFYSKANYSGLMTMTRKNDGKVIYSGKVTTDGQRRRHAHSPNSNNTRPYHLLIMGCSFIWGEWLNNEETLPWKVHQGQNSFSVYNLGYSAYNPSLTYRMVDKYGWLDAVPQKKGAAIYFIMGYTIDRFLANLAGIGDEAQPIYVPDGRGDFRFIGREEYRRSLRGRLQSIFFRTNIYQLFNISWPRANEKNYELFARMLKKIESKYKGTFGGDNEFYVAFYPFPFPPRDLAVLKAALDRQQIRFIDFSSRDYTSFSTEPTMLLDEHPNALANQFIADALIEQLSRLAPSPGSAPQWSATKN